ncbi:hypothetical protein SOVF_079080 [Spinacia oleracea]|nr:hypothetical protein SOVF_079080 [Spinacia oleracea]
MANSNVSQRQVSSLESTTPIKELADDEPKSPTSKQNLVNINISLSVPINIPSTQRILRNWSTFLPFYMTFIWIVLLITLIPRREHSLFLLLVNTNLVVMYLLALRAFPSSVLLHRWIDKRIIYVSFAVATMFEMILSDAGLHLFFTLVGTVPVILIHAVLQATQGYSVIQDQCTVANDRIADTV